MGAQKFPPLGQRVEPATTNVDPFAGVEISAYTLPLPGVGQEPLRIERVTRRDGSARWAVRWMDNALGKDGTFEYEPSPGNRDDDFLARCRFESAEAAVTAAREAIAAGACNE